MLGNKLKKNSVQIWVDPSFQNKLKVESAKKGMPIISYTKYLASEDINLNYENNDKTKKRFWNFEL
jgi:hypothetical protein